MTERYVPGVPDMVKKLARDTQLYIFNVGPWRLTREMGSVPTAIIPACPEGREYSEPYIVLGIDQEPYPVNETTCAMIPKSGPPGQEGGSAEGIYLAQQILGEGPQLNKRETWRRFGVFISKTAPPSEHDVRTARAALYEHLGVLVKEANDSWALDRDKGQIIQKDWHQRAAEMLHKTVAECPWMGDRQLGPERVPCPFCGQAIPITVAKCPNCKEVVNQALYKAAQMAAREATV
jgi:hypothetical protein